MSPYNLSLITTLLLVFGSALAGGFLAKKLKLPLVLGYIASGTLVNWVFGFLIDRPAIQVLGDIGISLLLFALGIEFSIPRLRHMFPRIGLAACMQILLVFGSVFVFLGILGFSYMPALFIAAAAALSSTAIVIKLLFDRGELDTIPGEIATGWLVMQDLAVIPMMLILPTLVVFGGNEALTATSAIAVSTGIIKSLVFLMLIVFLGKTVIPRFLTRVAGMGNPEILVLAVALVVLAAAGIGSAVGLSMAVGAFIAGLLVAETNQNHAVFAEIRPMRDLFGVIFFVTLGFALPLQFLASSFFHIAMVTIAIILLKAGIIYTLVRFVGYHRKTAFLVAVSLVQMSEFGFVLAKEGTAIGALTANQSTFLTAVMCGTIFLSVPLLHRAHEWYYRLSRLVGHRFPILFATKEEVGTKREEYPISDHIVLCGYGRVGKYIGRALSMADIPYLVVDYNQSVIYALQKNGIPAVYGDPAEREVLDFAQVDLARVIIIAIPDRHTQEMVVAHAHSLNRRIKIICRTHYEGDQQRLKSLGVHTVVQPEFEAALSIVVRVLGEFGQSEEDIAGKISRLKIEHGLG